MLENFSEAGNEPARTNPPVTLPPVLYLPRAGTDETSTRLEVLNLSDGRTALPVYTALARLLHCCGEGQPWVLIPTERLGPLDESIHFDLILIDQELPAELRRKAGP